MKQTTFQEKVLPLFFLSLVIASVGAYVGLFVPPVLYLPIVIAEFIILIATMFLRRRGNVGMWLVFLFVFLTGVTTTPILVWAEYTGGMQIIFQALGITSVVFGALSGYVYYTKKDFRSWGMFLTFALIGLILASVVNIFIRNDPFSIFIDVAVLLVFLGFVMYDVSKIMRDYGDGDVDIAVLSLYLDFLNIFIRILKLLALRKRD